MKKLIKVIKAKINFWKTRRLLNKGDYIVTSKKISQFSENFQQMEMYINDWKHRVILEQSVKYGIILKGSMKLGYTNDGFITNTRTVRLKLYKK